MKWFQRTRAPCRGHLWDLLLMRWESVNLVTSSTAPAAGRDTNASSAIYALPVRIAVARNKSRLLPSFAVAWRLLVRRSDLSDREMISGNVAERCGTFDPC
ncbi:unnamed protein product [Cladocopium goreaui]|uniref:Secreted protein n=1 Tax=Cladocopium goreaui TaxID=2562237 RepID=A0A9P1DKK0_9DINO|nr:unnamed protein product [Cladocopium goreaui]